jgi:diguanylate cyclase (GGDEF)-like protein
VTKDRISPAIGVIVCVALLCAHAGLNIAFPHRADAISYVFYIFWSLAALSACAWRAFRSPSAVQRSWALLAVALLFWLGGTVIAIHAQFFEHTSAYYAAIDDFFYFFYGVPILLALTSPEDTQLGRFFFWLDGIQIVAIGFLAYTAFFAVVPFSGQIQHPVPVQRLIGIYDVEDFLVAILAPIRAFACPRGSTERRFYKTLSAYLWIYAVSASIYNHIVATQNDAGVLDILVAIPFALLTLTAWLDWPPASVPSEGNSPQRLAVVIDNARPIFLGLALVALSGWIARTHLDLAMGMIFGAFVVYGIRSAMLQNRFSQTQKALEQASERLEQLVLQDGLTGIANRRCFDQRFHQEWARARRTGSPLSLLLMDIDHFKKLNDTYGHLTGDECLVQVAHILQTTLSRPGDLLARYGGEEFVALLPETDDCGALGVAQRLQNSLDRSQPLPSVKRQVTISIGATTWRALNGASAETVLATADRALYLAKQNGRNRTEYLPISDEA